MGFGGGAQAALGLPGLGFSVVGAGAAARAYSGGRGGGLGPPRASSGGPVTVPPFTAGLAPEDAAALGAPSAPPAPPSLLPAAKAPFPFHGPSRPGGDLPPRGVPGFFGRRLSGKGAGEGVPRDPGV